MPQRLMSKKGGGGPLGQVPRGDKRKSTRLKLYVPWTRVGLPISAQSGATGSASGEVLSALQFWINLFKIA